MSGDLSVNHGFIPKVVIAGLDLVEPGHDGVET
jgi:hypothetical protein